MASQLCSLLQIKRATELYATKQKTLKTSQSRPNVNDIVDRIKRELARFTLTVTSILKAANKEADATHTAYVEESKLDIIKSYITDSFLEKYQTQIRECQTSDSLLDLINSIFGGIASPSELVKEARKQLEEMTRFTQENEPFSVFLKRLESVGKLISTNSHEKIAELFVSEAFYRNLTPHLKQFLTDHGQQKNALKEIATFLDQKDKAKRTVHTNNIYADDNKIINLENQIALLTDLVKEAIKPNTSDEPEPVPEICAVSKRPEMKQPKQTYGRRVNWEYKNGKPVTCKKCGMFGHPKEKCLGLCKAVCHKCKRIGHLQTVCPAKNHQ